MASGQDARHRGLRACSMASNTSTVAASPITKPSRSRVEGSRRRARGSSLRVVRARAEQNEANRHRRDAGTRPPPTSTTSRPPVRMYSIARAMAWPLEAQAVTVALVRPGGSRNSMARDPAAAFGIIMAMSDGLTKRGPRFMHGGCAPPPRGRCPRCRCRSPCPRARRGRGSERLSCPHRREQGSPRRRRAARSGRAGGPFFAGR